ncbi:MAG: hypothetical protein ABL901_03370 [Hyphomicrobiaceae bacterium]
MHKPLRNWTNVMSYRLRRLVGGRRQIILVLSILIAHIQTAQAGAPEFGGVCAMGLVEGKRIKTNCKVNWTNGKDGKTYCFATDDSKAAFLNDPERNVQRAVEHFAMAEAERTVNDMGRFTAEDVTVFIQDHIAKAGDKTSGLFSVNDSMLGQTLALRLEKVDFVRTLHGYGFFPNVIFLDKDDAAKKYQIDFWVKPRGGKLEVVDTRVYKAPRKEGDKWVMFTRQPKPWWWIPASEHPGESEVKRSWQVMSALHEHIAAERTKGGGTYKLKDDKTGQEILMDFVGIHQPVRKLKDDGRYFACTDFRRQGSTEEYYDVDFWLNDKDGKITVGGVRLHKVPQMEDGSFIQMPRYSFDLKTFDVVP